MSRYIYNSRESIWVSRYPRVSLLAFLLEGVPLPLWRQSLERHSEGRAFAFVQPVDRALARLEDFAEWRCE